METREQLLKRIRSLVAVARDQSGLPEGEVAAAIADRLIRAHAVAAHELGESADPIAVIHVPSPAGWALWEQALMTVVGEFVGVQAAVLDHHTMWLCGHRAGLDVHAYLFDVAHRHIRSQARDRPEDPDWFCRSAVVGFQEKLRALRHASRHEDEPGTAILHLRDGAVVAWLADRGVAFGDARDLTFKALNAGLDAGRTVPVAPALSAGAGPHLLDGE